MQLFRRPIREYAVTFKTCTRLRSVCRFNDRHAGKNVTDTINKGAKKVAFIDCHHHTTASPRSTFLLFHVIIKSGAAMAKAKTLKGQSVLTPLVMKSLAMLESVRD
jgi:hypothetical protein